MLSSSISGFQVKQWLFTRETENWKEKGQMWMLIILFSRIPKGDVFTSCRSCRCLRRSMFECLILRMGRLFFFTCPCNPQNLYMKNIEFYPTRRCPGTVLKFFYPKYEKNPIQPNNYIENRDLPDPIRPCARLDLDRKIQFAWLWLVADTNLLWKNSTTDWLIAGDCCWFSLREQYYWLVG